MDFVERMEKSGAVRLMSLIQILMDKNLLTSQEANSIVVIQNLVSVLVEKGIVDPEEINVSDIQCRKFLQELYRTMFGDVSREDLENFEDKYRLKYPGMVNLARAFFGVKKNFN